RCARSGSWDARRPPSREPWREGRGTRRIVGQRHRGHLPRLRLAVRGRSRSVERAVPRSRRRDAPRLLRFDRRDARDEALIRGPTHLMVSWYFAEAADVSTPRDRRIVAWAGLMPDVDVLAYVGALVYYRFDKELAFENVWKEVHHRYTHNLAFVFVTGAV